LEPQTLKQVPRTHIRALSPAFTRETFFLVVEQGPIYRRSVGFRDKPSEKVRSEPGCFTCTLFCKPNFEATGTFLLKYRDRDQFYARSTCRLSLARRVRLRVLPCVPKTSFVLIDGSNRITLAHDNRAAHFHSEYLGLAIQTWAAESGMAHLPAQLCARHRRDGPVRRSQDWVRPALCLRHRSIGP
jgi:hypothetical protein